MPHRRKVRKEFSPQLKFEPESSYLYLEYNDRNQECLSVPLETLVIIFAIKYCDIKNIQLRLLKQNDRSFEKKSVQINIKEELELNHSVVEDIKDVPSQLAACKLPAWYLPNQKTCIAGLCSVVRYTLRLGHACEQSDLCRTLLGFQQGCLSAPQEVSTWTKFCEVDIHRSLEDLRNNRDKLPEDLSRFESHLRQPVRMHNIREKMQKSGKLTNIVIENTAEVVNENGINVDPINIYAKTQHVFAEGPEMLLSDILIFPIVYLIDRKYGIIDKYPKTRSWMTNMMSSCDCEAVLTRLLSASSPDPGLASLASLCPAPVPEESLYKCDPARKPQSAKTFTRQADINQLLDWWEESSIASLQQLSLPDIQPLDWAQLPLSVHPQAGCLPPDRLERKCGQLSSLAGPLVSLAAPGTTIVDFCSGGGHLGLLAAHLAPASWVHMVENKEESLARARARGLDMGLDNVWFYQCNLEFYVGPFNIGTSLHACGSATDLVVAKCVAQRAAVVSCPCCYGGVSTSLGVVSYPRSRQFRAQLGPDSFYTLAHSADQTHAGDTKSEQGYTCMDIVDTDRCSLLQELGYNVTLSKLQPNDCTPKNNLIVATPT